MEQKHYELEIAADIEKLGDAAAFVENILEENDCPLKAQTQINVAFEEIFVNIAHYAYPDGEGKAKLEVDACPEFVEITFIDSGIPYDPLAKADPDITLSAEERQIGGLGIFMTKKLMDEIHYKYEDNCNILTMKKNF